MRLTVVPGTTGLILKWVPNMVPLLPGVRRVGWEKRLRLVEGVNSPKTRCDRRYWWAGMLERTWDADGRTDPGYPRQPAEFRPPGDSHWAHGSPLLTYSFRASTTCFRGQGKSRSCRQRETSSQLDARIRGPLTLRRVPPPPSPSSDPPAPPAASSTPWSPPASGGPGSGSRSSTVSPTSRRSLAAAWLTPLICYLGARQPGSTHTSSPHRSSSTP